MWVTSIEWQAENFLHRSSHLASHGPMATIGCRGPMVPVCQSLAFHRLTSPLHWPAARPLRNLQLTWSGLVFWSIWSLFGNSQRALYSNDINLKEILQISTWNMKISLISTFIFSISLSLSSLLYIAWLRLSWPPTMYHKELFRCQT